MQKQCSFDFKAYIVKQEYDSTMQRRTVTTIKETLEPKQIFQRIMAKEWPYSIAFQRNYGIRDRAGMAFAFASVGRVTEIFGGFRYKRVYVDELGWKELEVGRHKGVTVENVSVTDNFIFVQNMPVVKRSQKVIDKYGPQAAQRDKFALPLKTGLYDNVFNDQLVPFSWLVLEYLLKCAPKEGKLFPYQDCRAWQIIKHCTGMFPNWFRAQADRFYGWYITRDSVKHSKFVGRVHAESSMPYIRYTWSDDLKEKSMAMDFDWIESTVEEIKERLD